MFVLAGLAVNIATGIVEENQFADYIKAIHKLAIALTNHAAAMDRQHEVKHTNALERQAEQVNDALNAPHRVSAPARMIAGKNVIPIVLAALALACAAPIADA